MTLDEVALAVSIMTGYDIEFSTIIYNELYERAFDKMTYFPFPCLMHRLCDEAGMLEVPGINKIVEATSMA